MLFIVLWKLYLILLFEHKIVKGRTISKNADTRRKTAIDAAQYDRVVNFTYQ
jgi:hypothetical protein